MLQIARINPEALAEYEFHLRPETFTEETARAIVVREKLPHGEGSDLGIMYVLKMWEGVGTTSAYLGPHVWGKSPIRMVRQVTRELDRAANELGLWRVQAESPYDAPRYTRWLSLLGFRLEASLSRYYPNGQDMWLLTKFYEENFNG